MRLAATRFLHAGLVALAALALLFLLALFINLPWFDEDLLPELASLRTPPSVSIEDNAYPLAFGFLAADGRDSRAAGEGIVEALRSRYEQGQRIALDPSELEALLGGSGLEEGWQSAFESLACNARVYMDCASRLIAEIAQKDTRHPRLSVLTDRYETLLGQTRFEESHERDAYTPFPPYGPIRNVARLRLASTYLDGSTAEFLRKAAQDFELWLTVLRDGEALATKMVALAGLQDTLDFLSTSMRNRALDESDLLTIQSFLRPLTRDESDIGEAFTVSEARIALLSEPHPMTYGLPWVYRLFIQENATLNEEYSTVFAPMRLRATLSARDYYRQRAYERLPYDVRMFPPPLYNLGGKLARESSVWSDDVQLYIARVHDLNGRISLVLLQSEIERNPDSSVQEIVRLSTHRNPYTDEPMVYDTQAQTIAFECLHTVYHPPAPPDVCAFPIRRRLD